MPEGLSPSEAGKKLAEHGERDNDGRARRTISIIEASLLALVAVLAAYSGWAAAKFSTEASLSLSRASAARAESNAANLEGLNSLNFDVTAFNGWFTAYVAHDPQAMAVAAKRFTPNFRRAFDAWLATKPATNPDSPPGPTYMPQYRQPEKVQAAALNVRATAEYTAGEKDGSTSDDYVRTTVYLATVLFLAGLGSHFMYVGIRYGLASVGSVILLISAVLLATYPKPF
jgi:hypothetical protein